MLIAIGLWANFRTTLALTGDQTAGGWAIPLAIAPGALFITGISFYPMQAHLVVNVLFAWLLSVPTVMRAVLAGLLGSFALVLHNPFPHAVFVAPWIVALLLGAQQRRLAGWPQSPHRSSILQSSMSPHAAGVLFGFACFAKMNGQCLTSGITISYRHFGNQLSRHCS